MKSILRSAAALTLGAGLAMSAHAADTWTYTTTNNGAGVDTASNGATALTTVGAYATNNGTNGISGNWTTGTAAAALTMFSGGLGMASDGDSVPNHAIDNGGINTEGVLLNFTTSTILTGIDLGYISGDADISVFRFTGTAPTLNGTGASLASMQTAGWQLVGNYYNLSSDSTAPFNFNLVNGATNSTDPTPAAGSVGSSWWLITAYNTAYGSEQAQGNDYFKLLAVAGSVCTGSTTKCGGTTTTNPPPPNRAPEPATLALTSVALLGMAGLRRRKAITPA